MTGEGFSQISRNSLITAPSYLPVLAICQNLLDLLKTFPFKKLIKYVAPLWPPRGAGEIDGGGEGRGGECFYFPPDWTLAPLSSLGHQINNWKIIFLLPHKIDSLQNDVSLLDWTVLRERD